MINRPRHSHIGCTSIYILSVSRLFNSISLSQKNFRNSRVEKRGQGADKQQVWRNIAPGLLGCHFKKRRSVQYIQQQPGFYK